MLFAVSTSERSGWLVVSIVGELDLASAPAVRGAVVDAFAARPAGPVRVVLDLSSVDFVDSAGLGVALGVVRRARALDPDADVRVVAGERVRPVLELVGLDRVLTFADGAEAVVAPTAGAGGG